jgi:transposase-like protein
MCQTEALQILVEALPDEKLRPLLMKLLVIETPQTQTGNTISAAPVAISEVTAAVTTTTVPAPVTKRPPGRPRIKPNATETGAKAARRLASLPGRDEMVAAVVAGTKTRAAAAKELGTSPKTVSNWVERHRREQQAQKQASASTSGQVREKGPAAAVRSTAPEQHGQLGLPIGGNGNSGSAEPVDPALAAKLWQHAADLSPTAPYRRVASEFGLNTAIAMEHCNRRTLPPLVPAAVERFLELST